jgi:hypothetical protein
VWHNVSTCLKEKGITYYLVQRVDHQNRKDHRSERIRDTRKRTLRAGGLVTGAGAGDDVVEEGPEGRTRPNACQRCQNKRRRRTWQPTRLQSSATAL